VGWTSQPFTTAILTWPIRGGFGSVSDRQRHVPGESGLLSLIRLALSQLARFVQLKAKGTDHTIAASSRIERREIHRESAFSAERDEEQDGLAHRFAKERDKEQNGLAQMFRE
jgi:hypothetical protein